MRNSPNGHFNLSKPSFLGFLVLALKDAMQITSILTLIIDAAHKVGTRVSSGSRSRSGNRPLVLSVRLNKIFPIFAIWSSNTSQASPPATFCAKFKIGLELSIDEYRETETDKKALFFNHLKALTLFGAGCSTMAPEYGQFSP